ncbi:MAG: 1-acyl-sn-glycerol-3-phosphate acyltransferase [Chloroflexi bacterium]|nr:1-acyl-sn-glycerol-3-phosphate acyltransferase [Chloroflexota bacterium]
MRETPFVSPICNIVQRLTLRLFADYKVEGKENVPPMGPLIVVANHQSYLDPPILGACLPRRIWFLAKDSIFRGPILNWFLRSYGAFPLDRFGSDLRAYRWALNKLERDQVLVLFPEGTRSKGSMNKALPGVARLALKTGAPLLPVGIVGTEHMGHWLRVLNPSGTIRVNIGTVFSLPSIDGRPSQEVLGSLTDMIMQRVATLLPEQYRGVYSIKPSTRATTLDRR